MSYRKEDHIPDRLMVRKCIMCGDEFQQMNWWQTLCVDCEFESEKEETEEDQGSVSDA